MTPQYRITLSFDVNLDTALPEHLAEKIEEAINDYSDGRYRFSSELLREGFTRLLTQAIEKSIYEHHRSTHGKTMVSTATGKTLKQPRRAISASSLASLLTDKAMKEINPNIYGQVKCVSLKEIHE